MRQGLGRGFWRQGQTGGYALCWSSARNAIVTEETQPKRGQHEVQRREAQVRGVVQGVGFRPFVYRLALEEGLAGFVGNDTDGVTIEIEGPEERVEAFLIRLRSDAPPLSRIDSITARETIPSATPASA